MRSTRTGSSRTLAILSFSSGAKETPWVCSPSRSVVSRIRTECGGSVMGRRLSRAGSSGWSPAQWPEWARVANVALDGIDVGVELRRSGSSCPSGLGATVAAGPPGRWPAVTASSNLAGWAVARQTQSAMPAAARTPDRGVGVEDVAGGVDRSRGSAPGSAAIVYRRGVEVGRRPVLCRSPPRPSVRSCSMLQQGADRRRRPGRAGSRGSARSWRRSGCPWRGSGSGTPRRRHRPRCGRSGPGCRCGWWR